MLYSLLILPVYYVYYKAEEDEVGGTCGTDGREEERV
jgi:hypothetical protein